MPEVSGASNPGWSAGAVASILLGCCIYNSCSVRPVCDPLDHRQIERATKPSRNEKPEDHPMADGYRIFGAEMSPYSVKIRSYFRYKAIPHQWILRNAGSQAEYEKYAKMPIIPLVVTPGNVGIQDSTPIIDQMEKLHPEPSINPDEPVTRFISAVSYTHLR